MQHLHEEQQAQHDQKVQEVLQGHLHELQLRDAETLAQRQAWAAAQLQLRSEAAWELQSVQAALQEREGQAGAQAKVCGELLRLGHSEQEVRQAEILTLTLTLTLTLI